LEYLARLVFKELDLLLNDNLWHIHYQGFMWDYYQVFFCLIFNRRF
jgi:hypothetical protein